MAKDRKKTERPGTTLVELITETPIGEEEQADLQYVESQSVALSQLPAYVIELEQRMKELASVRQRIDTMEKTKNSPVASLIQSLNVTFRRSVAPSYHATTIDELVSEELSITAGINTSVRKAVRHTRAEMKQLEQYNDESLQEYAKAKASMLRTDTQYNATHTRVEELEAVLTELKRADDTSVETKMQHRTEKRKLQTLEHRRNAYGSRVQFRLTEAPVLEKKEESLRSALYELQRMGEEIAMFHQHVERTKDSSIVLKCGYKTIEALQQSFNALSDAARAYELIGLSAAERFAEKRSSYSLPESTVTTSKRASDAIKPTRPTPFEKARDLINQPVMASSKYDKQDLQERPTEAVRDFLDELEPEYALLPDTKQYSASNRNEAHNGNSAATLKTN